MSSTSTALDRWLQEGDSHLHTKQGGESNYEAHWLYIVPGTHKWYITEDRTKINEFGVPEDAEVIDFNRQLPDKSYLTDPQNIMLLNGMMDGMFNVKESVETRDMDIKHFLSHFYSLCAVVDYVILNKYYLDPENYGYALMTKSDFKKIYADFGTDGRCGVARVIERVASFMRSLLLQDVSTSISAEKRNILSRNNVQGQIIYTFTDDELIKIKSWLYDNNAYHKDSRYYGVIKETFLYDTIGYCSSKVALSAKVKLYIRQFELATDYNRLEFSTEVTENTEFLGVGYETVEEAATKNVSMYYLRNFHRHLQNFSKVSHLVNTFPSIDAFDVDYEYYVSNFTRNEDTRTQTLPVSAALHYINEALRWVQQYGDDICDYYMRYATAYHKNISSATNMRKYATQIFNMIEQPKSLLPLNIVQFRSFYHTKNKGKKGILFNNYGGSLIPSLLRKEMSLEDAVDLYIAAVLVLLLSTSARRAMEVVDLKTGCVCTKADGHDLGFNLEKANFLGERLYLERPIPGITAAILEKFIEFGEKLKSLHGVKTTNTNHYALYVPEGIKKCAKMTYIKTRKYVTKFADFIQVEINENNRRLYAENHHFRRFFAITFFWQYRHASYPALAWFLGHLDPDHTARYITEMLSGKELTEEERALTKEAILSERTDDIGVNTIRQWAFNHFGVDDVRIVKESLLDVYLLQLQEAGKFSIETDYIETADSAKINIIWKVSEVAAE